MFIYLSDEIDPKVLSFFTSRFYYDCLRKNFTRVLYMYTIFMYCKVHHRISNPELVDQIRFSEVLYN